MGCVSPVRLIITHSSVVPIVGLMYVEVAYFCPFNRASNGPSGPMTSVSVRKRVLVGADSVLDLVFGAHSLAFTA